MASIEFRNVSFAYPATDRPALDDISFKVEKSQFIVVCGRSGCGKSTLLRHLKKNLTPYGHMEGSVQYNGMDIASLDDRINASQIGFVQQNPDNQLVTDKVWHELAFGLENLGYDNMTIKRRVAEMASFFDIQTWFRKNTSELSGGQKQLVNLASIMAMRPSALILDEPTAQLDPIAASEFVAALAKINRELGTMVIISEHRLEELIPLADKVLVMDKGRIISYDDPKKTGEFLQEDEPSGMFYGLPSVMKIYSRVRRGGECPLTVRESRLWLEGLLGEPHAQQARPEAALHNVPEPKPADCAIYVDDLWYKYDRRGNDLLRGVHLAVKKGEFFALLGGNGVGKSTTMKALARIIKPQRGTIMINGKKINELSDEQLFENNLAMLPQNPQALFTEITVREELLEAFAYRKMPQAEIEKRVSDMLELLELSPLVDMHPYDLSGGEQQRLALGKILLLEPQILLMDEPTKGLDPFFKRQLAGVFKKLQAQGVTILMVTHDIEFSARYADRCGLFFDGDVMAVGDAREFFAGNNFYTTSANRVAGEWFPAAVTWEEVAQCVAESI